MRLAAATMTRAPIKSVLRRFGVEFRRIGRTGDCAYIDATQTVSAARAQGLSVCEYVESLWDQRGCTDRVVEEMQKAHSLSPCDRVCEIGPGTARYLERVLRQTCPKQYDIYEIADDWATYIEATYGPTVVRQPADGRTLRQTPNASCALVHAHGVFVALPLLHAFEYFAEMLRVCAPNGYVAFDFYSEEHFDTTVISRWLTTSSHRYPVILPRKIVLSYFREHRFDLVSEFDNKHGLGYSHYVVLKKVSTEDDVPRFGNHSRL